MEKTKNKRKNSGEIRPIKFLVAWFFAATVVWGLFAIFHLIIALALFIITEIYNFPSNLTINLYHSTSFLSAGLSMGILQKFVIQKYLHIQPKRWIAFSLIGSFVGGIFYNFLANFHLNVYIGEPIPSIIFLGSVLALISFGHWFELRKLVHDAWLWVLANIVGGMSAIIFLYNFIMGEMAIHFVLLAILDVTILSLTTGGTLLWLFKHRRITKDKLKTEELAATTT